MVGLQRWPESAVRSGGGDHNGPRRIGRQRMSGGGLCLTTPRGGEAVIRQDNVPARDAQIVAKFRAVLFIGEPGETNGNGSASSGIHWMLVIWAFVSGSVSG